MIFGKQQLQEAYTEGLKTLLNDGYIVTGIVEERYWGLSLFSSNVILRKGRETIGYGVVRILGKRERYSLATFKFDERGRETDIKSLIDFWNCMTCYATTEEERDQVVAKQDKRRQLKEEWPENRLMTIQLKKTPWKGFRKDVTCTVEKDGITLTNRNGRRVYIHRGQYRHSEDEPLFWPRYELVKA